MSQKGIPLFYLQGMGGGAVLKFRDLFNDNSLHWSWKNDLGSTPAGKHTLEALGRYSLWVDNGSNGKWDNNNRQAPMIFISPLAFPCEIITRLDVMTVNDETFAGLFISKRPMGFGGNLSLAIGRRRRDLTTTDGICVVKDSYALLHETSITDLPVWLRVRLGCDAYESLNAYFDYSLDGLHWNFLYREYGGVLFSLSVLGVGIYVANGVGSSGSGSTNAVRGEFDHFLMKPKTPN